MLFEPQTAELRPLLRALGDFVRDELLPLERPFLDHDFDALLPALSEKRRLAKSLGFWLPQIAADHGGMGLSLFEHGLVSEVLGRTPLGHYALNCQAPDPAASRYQRASMILVPADTPGFHIVRNTSVMGERGQGWASHAEIRYDDCRVPQSNRLGAEGMGFVIAQQRLGPGRIHHCMRWIGICERAFEMMCRHANLRHIAPGRPLAEMGQVQTWVAESRAEIDAARLLVLQTAQQIDREGAHAARDGISLIKFHVARVLQDVLDRAIQVHGALGMTDETPLAFWYRHERAARIYDGPDEVHKWSVARRILGRYG